MKSRDAEQPSTPERSILDAPTLLIEFIGAFAFTYVSCWTVIWRETSDLSFVLCCLAPALVLICLTAFGGHLSGGHFNPAITIGLSVVRKLDWSSAVFYVTAQFLGGLTAGGFVFIQMDPTLAKRISESNPIGLPLPGSDSHSVGPFWGELVGCIFLMYIFLSAAEHSKPLLVGLAYFFLAATLGEIGGGSFNPVRVLGPAIIIGKVGSVQFMQLLGPLVGCICAALIHNSMFSDDDEDFSVEDEPKEKQALNAEVS